MQVASKNRFLSILAAVGVVYLQCGIAFSRPAGLSKEALKELQLKFGTKPWVRVVLQISG
jgi:hypothetical protein